MNPTTIVSVPRIARVSPRVCTPLLVLFSITGSLSAQILGTPPNTVAVPPGNPITPAKTVLGKILFHEEQMSTANDMACATCHLPHVGGGDPRAGRIHPGPDLTFNTLDDLRGSPGVLPSGITQDYLNDPSFGVTERVTGRNSPTVIGAAFFQRLFWDSRAAPPFVGATVTLPAPFGGLENLVFEPPISPTEMGHDGIAWPAIVAKIAGARPMKLASNLTPDIVAALAANPTYAGLFQAAFGTPVVTQERIQLAIATYMRVLIPNQTPLDLGTLTPAQQAGRTVFATRGNPVSCTVCHPFNGLLSDGLPHNIGLPNHSLTVKTPTLKNVGLRRRFMHSGQFGTIDEALSFYNHELSTPPSFGFQPPLTATEKSNLRDFLVNGLRDNRINTTGGQHLPPFDRPTLRSEIAPLGSNYFGQPWPGTGGIAPQILANTPPNIGNNEFKFGVGRGLGGSVSVIGMSTLPGAPGANFNGVPLYVDLGTTTLFTVPLSGTAGVPGVGVGTVKLPIPNNPAFIGVMFFVQAFVVDFQAIGQFAASSGASFTVF